MQGGREKIGAGILYTHGKTSQPSVEDVIGPRGYLSSSLGSLGTLWI